MHQLVGVGSKYGNDFMIYEHGSLSELLYFVSYNCFIRFSGVSRQCSDPQKLNKELRKEAIVTLKFQEKYH